MWKFGSLLLIMCWRWKTAQWFELRWWKKYLAQKPKHDYLQWKRIYWHRILSLLSFKIKPDDRVADIGCGPAGIFIALPENKVVAVDPLINRYESELSFFRKADYPNVTFIESPLEEFNDPLKFDFVFCMNAINHVKDIQQGIINLKSLCKNEGTLVVSVDAHNHALFKALFRLIPADVLHPHQYGLKEYKKKLREGGCKVSVPYLLKEGFLFNHYVLVCRRGLSE